MGTAADKGNNASAQAKLTQVKVSADPRIASAFKEACAAAGVSMASVLTQFMAEYSGAAIKRKPQPDYSTGRQRRSAAKTFMQQMAMVRDAEERYMDNIPENLQGSVNYEMSEERVAAWDEAIEVLSGIY